MQTDYLPLYPPLRLDHMERLTDCTGILQHAVRSVPDPRHGYSIDDQARALIVVLQHASLSGMQHAPRAAYTYLSYLQGAATPERSFHNFLAYDRSWLDKHGSADSHGRALWALGFASRFGIDKGLSLAAAEMFGDASAYIPQLKYPRSWAFTLFGLYHRLKAEPDEALVGAARVLANQLLQLFEAAATPDWLWFENTLTYCNAKLPASLFLAYEVTGESRFLDIGQAALTWLFRQVMNDEGELRLVGQDGWYPRGGVKAAFDEQCVDAQNLIEAAVIAHRITGAPVWQHNAMIAFDWFVGRNVHGVSLVDTATWGCYDGITTNRLNRNMGAESTLCYLLAYLDLVAAGMLTLDGAVPQSE